MRDSGTHQPTLDHIVPVAAVWRSNHADDLQLAHMVCNVKKRDHPGSACEPTDHETLLESVRRFDY